MMRPAPFGALAVAAALLAGMGAPRADVAPPPPGPDDLPLSGDLQTGPGELDGSWRVVIDDGSDQALVTFDIAHAANEPRAAGVFTALPGLCPPVTGRPPDDDCEWDGTTGEITDIVLTDDGLIISFNPSADVADEQNLRLKSLPDGTWRGILDGKPPRKVAMIRPPE